uniref:G-protein coupled receptors family 1 profile domain-containing protein n=1 Tax=Trichogramma kaykai TaxID=54128 RepID=A0ABD2X0J1_9HYME
MSSLLNLAGPTFSSISNSEGKNIGNNSNSDPISKIISDIGVGAHPDTSAAEEVIQPGLVSIIIAIFLVFVLSLNTLACNSIILAAFYRYKRLRTASNCLLMSLAVSDFGVRAITKF